MEADRTRIYYYNPPSVLLPTSEAVDRPTINAAYARRDLELVETNNMYRAIAVGVLPQTEYWIRKCPRQKLIGSIERIVGEKKLTIFALHLL